MYISCIFDKFFWKSAESSSLSLKYKYSLLSQCLTALALGSVKQTNRVILWEIILCTFNWIVWQGDYDTDILTKFIDKWLSDRKYLLVYRLW